MDNAFFFRDRVRLVRYYYQRASAPFADEKNNIENDNPPFDDPPYSEDAEPTFMEEWSNADTALEMLGHSSIAMLAASLKLYFDAWERRLDIEWSGTHRQWGWTQKLVHLCEQHSIAIMNSSVDLPLIEQVFLARNRSQHPDSITTMRVKHSTNDREKYPRPFFISESEQAMYLDSELKAIEWLNPSVHVSESKLIRAIDESELLVIWLEKEFLSAESRKRGSSQ